MTLTRVSGVGLEQASMTDTPKFGPSVCLAVGISANPNQELRENTNLYARLTEGQLNYKGALHTSAPASCRHAIQTCKLPPLLRHTQTHTDTHAPPLACQLEIQNVNWSPACQRSSARPNICNKL